MTNETTPKSKRAAGAELEIEDVVVSRLGREALGGAANASAVVEPIADLPKSTKGAAGA